MAEPPTARRRRILEAALAVFVQLGYRKATMADVAEAAGISRQAVYLQFQSKQELLLAAVEHELDRALTAVREALAAPGHISDRTTDALDAWLGKATGENADNVAVLGRENATELASTFDQARHDFIEELATAIEADQHIDPARGRTVAGALHASATGWKHLAQDRTEFRARVHETAALIVRGVAAG